MNNPVAGYSGFKKSLLMFPPWVWFSISLFFFATTVLLIYAQLRAKDLPVRQVAAHRPPPTPLRNTFTAQTDDLIQRYNRTIFQIEQKLTLPSADLLREGARNDIFHVMQYPVTPNITVQFEIENVSNKPFSIGVIGAPVAKAEIESMVAIIGTLGVTVFGKGDNDGVLARTCTAAVKSKDQTLQIRREDLDVYCTYVMGGWIAGISVPRQ